tara:strand:+ start:241 stop:381 length:141 start_codon:yes stop_codon:yes gene_type:complete
MSDFISGFFSWGNKTEKKEEPKEIVVKEKTRKDKEYLKINKNTEEE